MRLNDLDPRALAAALTGGTTSWGEHGSTRHARYFCEASPRSRRRCHCGCKRRATYCGMANGVSLTMGCELYIRRWMKDSYNSSRAPRMIDVEEKGSEG